MKNFREKGAGDTEAIMQRWNTPNQSLHTNASATTTAADAGSTVAATEGRHKCTAAATVAAAAAAATATQDPAGQPEFGHPGTRDTFAVPWSNLQLSRQHVTATDEDSFSAELTPLLVNSCTGSSSAACDGKQGSDEQRLAKLGQFSVALTKAREINDEGNYYR